MFRIPVGSVVLPSTDADLEHLLETHREAVAFDPAAVDPRLRNGMTTVVATTNPGIHTRIAEQARQLGSPVVTVGDNTTVNADVVIPSNAAIALLKRDDVTNAGPVVVVGDVHNCHRTLRSMLVRLGIDGKQDGTAPLLVLVGDLVNKGGSGPADALETLDLVMDLVRTGRAVSLRGNHDLMLVRRVTGQLKTTPFTEPLVTAVASSDGRADYVRFLSAMPLAVNVGDGTVAVHANFSPMLHGAKLPKKRRQAEQICCFGKPATDEFAGTIVHGHESVKTPKVKTAGSTTRINVDTGACKGRELTGWFVGSDPQAAESFVSVPTHHDDLPPRKEA